MSRLLPTLFVVASLFAANATSFAQEKRVVRAQVIDVDTKLGAIGLRFDAPYFKLQNVQGCSFKKANVYLPNYVVQPNTCDAVFPMALRSCVGPWGQKIEPAPGQIVSVEITSCARGCAVTAIVAHGKLPVR